MRTSFTLSIATIAGSTLPVFAENVDFTGTVVAGCTLAVDTPGTMALNTDGTELSSDNALGATVTILSVGTNTVTVGAPSLESAPTEYLGTPTTEVKYTGLAGLAAVDQAFTDQSTNFAVSTLPLTELVVGARATDTGGFEAGTYVVRTVVTCE
ncbi:hypothetical protein [Roseobacter sp. HKCCA0434]|uniref:hypothetical protein n=1 Tax=Roseobacter sp. HKCCA0434 TaxID=3079297 RepID=UPI0029057E9B|nr:hypothetical protein [Roseobacter sp. HKCCA0434]